MENTLQYKILKPYIKVLLLILTILSTCLVIWVGFTGRESILPFLLTLTLFFSISNLMLIDENPNRKKFYRALFFVLCLSVVLAFASLFV
ncbi:hypothetical protein J2R98_002691 [Alkalibacillus filiformis]|uniref:DUF3953 domain-containing protein n=1 Tax=Alkalibacillus filiformis TaxID=200990 RepID=A0ABU0DXG8_9BACI|nr:hypothetical protein [Alkalibacillus filiformis]MDQ0352840.1 hypothetical protein [Alkalibacillus filiformis]